MSQLVDKLRETLEELKLREPDAKKKFRTRVVVVGPEIDDPELISLIEDSGALVLADRRSKSRQRGTVLFPHNNTP